MEIGTKTSLFPGGPGRTFGQHFTLAVMERRSKREQALLYMELANDPEKRNYLPMLRLLTEHAHKAAADLSATLSMEGVAAHVLRCVDEIRQAASREYANVVTWPYEAVV